MPKVTEVYSALNHRVWYVEGGVHPDNPPELLTLGKISTDPSQNVGEETKITAPDPNDYEADIQVGTVRGSIDRATLSLSVHTNSQKSILMGWKNKRCRVDVFVLVGKCKNPQDFTEGSDKMYYFPDGKISTHGYENLGAWGADENNPTNEMVDMTAQEYYEILPMSQEQIGSTYTTRQVYTVDVYIGNACENCPEPCDRVLATMAGASATPGTQPVLLYSEDGGETFSQQTITSLFSNEDIVDGEVIGGDVVYISNTANEIHYTDVEMLYDGTNTWQQVATGFVKNKGARAISAVDPRHVWIVGDGGYIYFASNYKVGVVVQDPGVLTTQNLLAVHAFDKNNILTVGNSNAVIYSKNGGVTWTAATGPAVGINLGACWMWSPSVWFVGEGAGGTGKLWKTTNSGRTWTQIGLPGANYVRVYKIKFVSEGEGYLSMSDGSQSYVLRTKTAGNEWVVLPEGSRNVAVDNTFLTDLAVCARYANTAFAAGLAPNGTAGMILKMSGG